MIPPPINPYANMSATHPENRPTPKMCSCGKTQDPAGHCDGSHAKPARPKCGCGKTQNSQGYCDGSHAK